MCGIVGVVTSPSDHIDTDRLQDMTDALSHRGPDGSGLWVSNEGSVGFGHRRLSIIDVSDAGSQPMTAASGRYVIVFNGEIYNFRQLRQELVELHIPFRGHSDTEVILAACDAWGIGRTLERLNGMFTIALWDREKRELTVARDRVGIKPLYYSVEKGQFLFASELRPIVRWIGQLPVISQQGLREYIRRGHVPGSLSIFEGISKLLPGHVLVFRDGKIVSNTPFWALRNAVKKGQREQFSDSQEALGALERQLLASVERQMISDVPLGAFLSGGVDSSTVVALMQAQSSKPVKSFSIGFEEADYNEAEHAAAVAAHIGTDHTELYLTEKNALDVVPRLANIYDEPFADISQIPTFLVSKLAGEHVTVSLSGDGGDELFAGYNRYLFVARYWQRLQGFPLPIRRAMAKTLGLLNVQQWDGLFSSLGGILPDSFNPAQPGEKMHKIASVLPSPTLSDLYTRLVSQWPEPGCVMCNRDGASHMASVSRLDEIENLEPAIQQSVWDIQGYMVDDILTKVDRASMAVGLEARVPLLDQDVVEMAWRIPYHMKVRNGQGKWLLRQLLYKYVPQTLIDRPKMGFSVPVDQWLRKALRNWAGDFISKDSIRAGGYLNNEIIGKIWSDHQLGHVNAGMQLWTILMFQLWLEETKTWLD